jgi:DNA-binding beta-propeller fold protein YncE
MTKSTSRLLVGVLGTVAAGGLGLSLMAADTTPRLFFLDIRGGRVLAANPDGSGLQVLVDDKKESPDGIAVDAAKGHIYWSNMGRASEDDGSVFRTNLDGSHFTTLVPKGGTFTAKQMKLDETHGKMYWSDREGMRIQRANLDGSHVETLVVAGKGEADRADQANWCVGIAIDPDGGKVYWTQKGSDNSFRGTIRRANLEIPKGQTAENRTDIEILFDALPEPIDLDLDLKGQLIYWTDRGDAPRGNTVNRAPMKKPGGVDPKHRQDIQILFGGLDEAIGVALDVPGNRLYVTDLGGNLVSAKLDGSDRRTLGTKLGALTGIAFAHVPVASLRPGTTQQP